MAYTKRLYNVRTNNLVSSLKLSYQLIHGLNISSSFGYTNMQVDEIATTPVASLNPSNGINTGSSSFGDNNIRSWIFEPQLTYSALVAERSTGSADWCYVSAKD